MRMALMNGLLTQAFTFYSQKDNMTGKISMKSLAQFLTNNLDIEDLSVSTVVNLESAKNAFRHDTVGWEQFVECHFLKESHVKFGNTLRLVRKQFNKHAKKIQFQI